MKFMKVGEVINGYMLCQVSGGVGKLIDIKSGNRFSDTCYQLKNLKDSDGKFTYGFKFEDHEFEELFGYDIKVTESALSVPPKKKDDVVKIVRYIRAKNEDGQIDNLSGVTLIIYLDYVNRKVLFQYSICSGDNFDKFIGKRIAKNRRQHIIDMPPEGIPENGTVSFIMQNMLTKQLGIPVRDAASILTEYQFR